MRSGLSKAAATMSVLMPVGQVLLPSLTALNCAGLAALGIRMDFSSTSLSCHCPG